VKEFGVDRMAASLTHLRQLNADIEKRCVIEVTDKKHLKKDSDLVTRLKSFFADVRYDFSQ
jgi:hypothetical protein